MLNPSHSKVTMKLLMSDERQAINVIGMFNCHPWENNTADWIACTLTGDQCEKCGGPMYRYTDCINGTPGRIAGGPWCLLDRSINQITFPPTYFVVRRAVDVALSDDRAE